MNFKRNAIYTALFTSVSFAAMAETSQADSAQLEEIQINAKNSNQTAQHSYQSKESNIANKGTTPLIDSPQSVNVVNQQLLDDRKAQSIDEALATVSGTTQANTLGGIFDAVLKRGFGKNRDNSILRNGVVAGPSHNLTATTERLEVLKGPASVLYGIQDPGGVINVVTKKPLDKAKYVLGTSIGNHNMWGVNFDATGPLSQGFSYRFIFDQSQKDYWRNFGKIKRGLYAPSLSWKNDKTEITLAYEHQDYVDPFDRGTYIIAKGTGKGEFVDIPLERRLDEPFNQNVGKIDSISLNVSHQLNDAWKLNATYGYTRDTYAYYQARVTKIDLKTREATRTIEGILPSDQRTHSASVNLVGEFATGNVAHRLVTGVDSSRTTLDIHRYQGKNYSLNIDNPIYNTPDLTTLKLAEKNGHQFEKLKTVGVYLQDSAYLTEKLILALGLRYEYYDQIAGRGGSKVADRNNTDAHGGKLLKQAGLVYKFTPDWAVYGNYAESFRPQLSRAAIVNSGLKPEQGKSFEIGTKYENADFSSNLALFTITKNNVTDTYSLNDETYAYLVGKVRSKGLEWDFNGKLTDKIGITATYAYTKTKTLENSKDALYEGTQFEGVPKHQASLFATYDFGQYSFGHVRVGAGARYLGTWTVYNETRDTAGTLTKLEPYKLPSAVVADAFIAYDTHIGQQQVGLQFNVKNLTNKRYYSSTQGLNNSVIPVALGYGREFLLNAKLEF